MVYDCFTHMEWNGIDFKTAGIWKTGKSSIWTLIVTLPRLPVLLVVGFGRCGLGVSLSVVLCSWLLRKHAWTIHSRKTEKLQDDAEAAGWSRSTSTVFNWPPICFYPWYFNWDNSTHVSKHFDIDPGENDLSHRRRSFISETSRHGPKCSCAIQLPGHGAVKSLRFRGPIQRAHTDMI